ncbi:hypothetical protein QL093DRAFT_2422153 [Fusarium oxysporum]|nr:hypothetical protein QL093DRAFT_2422153 [Fusarium oxysporum]
MIRQHTPSKIARCPAQQTQKDLGFAAEEENIFPYFCMTCDREFTPYDHQLLYCSLSCRKCDQDTNAKLTNSACHNNSNTANLPFYSASTPAPRDIVPRASPTRVTNGFSMLTSS